MQDGIVLTEAKIAMENRKLAEEILGRIAKANIGNHSL